MTYMRSCCCGSGITCFFPDGRRGSGATGTCCYMEPLGNCCVQGYIYPNDPSSGKVYLEKIDCIKELTKSECDSYNILGQQKGTWTLYGGTTTCADPDKAECSENMCGSTYPNGNGEDDPGDDVPPDFCKLYNVDLIRYSNGGDCYPTSPCRVNNIYLETYNEFYFSGGGFDIENRELNPLIYDRDISFEEFCDPQFPAERYTKEIYKVKTTYLGLVRVGTKRRGWRYSLRLSTNNPRDGDCSQVVFFSHDDSGGEKVCIATNPQILSNASAPPNNTLEPSAGNPIKTNRHLCDCISNITECDCANKNAKSWDAARNPITGYSGKTGGDWIWTESGDCNLTTAGATGIIGCRGACCVLEAGIPTAENPCPDWIGIECIDNTTQCECDQFTEYGSDGQATKYGDFKGLGTTCGGTDCLPTSPCLRGHTCQNNIIIKVAVATATRKISGQYNCQCAGEGGTRTNTYTEDSEETYWKYNRDAVGCVCNQYFGQKAPFIFYDENTPAECTYFNNCIPSPNPDTLTFDYGECGSKVITGEVKFQDIGQIIIPPCGLWLKPGTFKKEMIVSSAGCGCQGAPYPYINYDYRLIETYYFPNVATFYYGCNGTADIPNPWGDASSNNTRIETITPNSC